jgi:hypothetical protein
MVAERDNQRVTKERTSALILLANARVWTSEGWQVSITDSDGKALDPAGFEEWLGPLEASPLQHAGTALLEEPQDPPLQELPLQSLPLSDETEERVVEASETVDEAEGLEHDAPEIGDIEQADADARNAEERATQREGENRHEMLAVIERALEDHDMHETSGST